LRRFAVDEADWQRYLSRQRRTEPGLMVNKVTLDTGTPVPPPAVLKSIKLQSGKPLDPDILAADLDEVWRLGEFETVDFALTPAELDARSAPHRTTQELNKFPALRLTMVSI
jgi:hypothetical protein